MVMRFVLAILAVLALVANPLAAAADQGLCEQSGHAAMTGMDMRAMPGVDQSDPNRSAADPCCDPVGQHGKKNGARCALSCAATCFAAVAVVSPLNDAFVGPMRADAPPARLGSLHPYSPPGLRPPP